MKVFVTGASGFIGSAVVRELLNAGHRVTGLARSEASAKAIHDAGAEVLAGTLEDLDVLKEGASRADGVIHMAFGHDFNQYSKANNADKEAINAIGEMLTGTTKPLVVTAGLGGLSSASGTITEDDRAQNSLRSSEAVASELASKGIHASVVRLPPSVHGKGDKAFVPFMISRAQKNGVSAYPADGSNRWPAVHRLDAARLFRLALEKGTRGALYNAVGDSAVTIKAIAALIGEKMNLPVVSVSGDAIAAHFEWLSFMIVADGPATAFKTREQLGWEPAEIGLLEDIAQNYFQPSFPG